jgi:vancomycin resistance protein YoaR
MAKGEKKKSKGNLLKFVRAAFILLVLAALGFGSYALLLGAVPAQNKMQVLFDSGVILPTVSIDGVNISGMTPAQARAAINDRVVQMSAELSVKLKYPDRTELLPAQKIGVYPNADDTIRKAMRLGREGGISARKIAAASGTTLGLTLGYTYDANTLEASIKSAAEKLDTTPREPSVSVSDGKLTVTDGKDGVSIDVPAFVSSVRAAVEDGSFGPVALPGTPLPPKFSTRQIQDNTKLIASTSTVFDDNTKKGRGFNINKMCGILSGSVILPGEEFSVNDKAGPRNAENGWELAKGLENGIYTDQYGGGICQVSTTLYDSLLKADLEITERRPHSIPSGYVQRGLDATVNTGGPDLKFRNNTKWPVYLVLRVEEPNGTGAGIKKKVVAEIYGCPLQNGMVIELVSIDKVHIPFDPLVIVKVADPNQVRKGRDYYKSEVWKIYRDANGKEIRRERVNTSVYKGNPPHELDLSTPSPSPAPSPT